MQRIVIIANGAAYGSESLFNSLRLAIALREQQSDLDLKLFLMSDAVTAGLRGQKPAEGYNVQQMLEILTAQQVPVKLCKPARTAAGSAHCRWLTAWRLALSLSWPSGPWRQIKC